MTRLLILGLLLVPAIACDADPKGAGPTGCDEGDVDVDVPIAVDCSFAFADTQLDLTYLVDGGAPPTPVGGSLIASGALTDGEDGSRTFSMTIYAEDGSVSASTLYQMNPARRPANEFVGDHGFTGLNSVSDPDTGEGVQFACFARDPSDPPHAWED